MLVLFSLAAKRAPFSRFGRMLIADWHVLAWQLILQVLQTMIIFCSTSQSCLTYLHHCHMLSNSSSLFDVLLCFGFLTLSIYSLLLSQCAFDFFASFGSTMQLLTLPSILLGTLQWRQLKELTERSIKGPCSNLNRGLWFAIGPLIYPQVRKLYFPYSKANRHLQQTPSNFCRS